MLAVHDAKVRHYHQSALQIKILYNGFTDDPVPLRPRNGKNQRSPVPHQTAEVFGSLDRGQGAA
jgi:hypothetical protein